MQLNAKKRGAVRRIGSTLFRGEKKNHTHIYEIFPTSQEQEAAQDNFPPSSVKENAQG
ncbi:MULTISPECIES: hypothetical protein [Legionella]|uniref:hypothetical protein n=1 Tax=Legionella TaxID=445 RepID=UPI001ACB6AF0|nr:MULTISPECIES: hypothetical protein [Legionella]MBN9228115.1 hypothetical protein [Legionella steelei]